MIFGNRSDQYRSLLAYLEETRHQGFWRSQTERMAKVWAAALLWPVPATILTKLVVPFVVQQSLAFRAIFGALFLVGLGLAWKETSRVQDEASRQENQYKIEAQKILDAMRAMNQYRRLHRDLSEATLTVLDDIARTRLEIRQLLDAPYWKAPNLGETYRLLRVQALEAADQAIRDAVIQFRSSIHTNVQPRHLMDYVDEAVSQFAGSKRASYAEPGFDAAFDIAHKLQILRAEILTMTEKADSDHLELTNLMPGSGIDAAMSEIRNLRQAESELKQGL